MIEKAIVDSGGDINAAVNALMDAQKPKSTIKSKGFKMEVMDDEETEVICLDCDSDEEEEDATEVVRTTRSGQKKPPAAKAKKKAPESSAKKKKTKTNKSGKKTKRKGGDDDDDKDDDSDFKIDSEDEDEEEIKVNNKFSIPKIKIEPRQREMKKRDRENDTTSDNNSLLFGNTDDRDIKELLIQNSPLHQIHWQRIVLDEAHKIKARTTSTAKAVYALDLSLIHISEPTRPY